VQRAKPVSPRPFVEPVPEKLSSELGFPMLKSNVVSVPEEIQRDRDKVAPVVVQFQETAELAEQNLREFQVLKPKQIEEVANIPKIVPETVEVVKRHDVLGVEPVVDYGQVADVFTAPIVIQNPFQVANAKSVLFPTLATPSPIVPVPSTIPSLPPNLDIGGGPRRKSRGWGAPGFGGVFRQWPVRKPKDVFAMSVKRMRKGMTYGSKVHPAMRTVQKASRRASRRRKKR